MSIIGNKKVKSVLQVSLSNITSIISGILVGLLLPKILPVEDYGWCKTFSLYATYAGFFSLGIIDGIVLKHGGEDYKDISRSLFRSYFRAYILVNGFFAVLLLALSVFVQDRNYAFILLMLSLYVIAVNVSGYFQQISQITQRFKEYSLRKIIISALKVIIVGLLFLGAYMGFEPNYFVYLAYFMASEYLLTIWYVYTYRDIVIGDSIKIRSIKQDLFHLVKIGFPLLFANLCSTLILSLDRQFVSLLFDTETYAVYAFAYNMLALVTVAMSAISTVLYPTLKRTTSETMKKNYSTLVSIITMMVFAAISVYFPLCIIVKVFLPKYINSLAIFRIVFPGLALSSSITVVMHNYYKALGKNNAYFKKSIVVLIVSAIANGGAYMIFHSTESISVASIITMLFWYIFIEQLFVTDYSYDRKKNLGYLLMMMTAFYIVTIIENHLIGFALYLVVYIVLTFSIYKTVIRKDLPRILNRK